MPDDEGLREQIARTIYNADRISFSDHGWEQQPPHAQELWRDMADAVLAVPAVVDALAAVERVRALADDIAYCWDDENTTVEVVVAAILRALDGGQ